MALTALPYVSVTRGGVSLNFALSDNVNGNSLANDGRMWLICTMKSAPAGTAPCTITIPTTMQIDADPLIPNSGLGVAVRTYTCNAGDAIVMGPFEPSIYNQPDGTVTIRTSSSQALAAVRLP